MRQVDFLLPASFKLGPPFRMLAHIQDEEELMMPLLYRERTEASAS